MRWQANLFTYLALLRDEYPPFSWEPGAYPLSLDIPYAGRQSRVRLFVRLFTILPNQFVFQFVAFAWIFTTFLSWFAILITGQYPRGLFRFSVGVGRWYQRQFAYLLLLRDEHPPYSINADARPGNEWVSGMIGLPFFVAYVALYSVQLSSVFRGGATTTTALSATAIERDHPSVHAGSLRITLLDYNPDASSSDARKTARVGYQIVSFRVESEKDGLLPTFFSPYVFSATTCRNFSHGVLAVQHETTDFDLYWTGGHDTATIYFEIPKTTSVCELSYYSSFRPLKFKFR